MIEIDTETTGVQWYAHELFLVQFDDGFERVALRHPAQRREIQTWLDRDDIFRASNAKFDFHFLKAAGYRLPHLSRIVDAMISFHLVDSTSKLALKDRAFNVLGGHAAVDEKRVKEWLAAERRRRKKEATENETELIEPNYADVPDELMIPYALNDLVIQRELCNHYRKTLVKEPKLQELYKLERDVTEALFVMEERGMPIEKDDAEALYRELGDSVTRLEQECIDIAGDPDFNPRSPKQLLAKLLERGVPEEDVTKTARNAKTKEWETKLSADVETLSKLDDELAAKVLQFRAEDKIRGTYVAPMLEKVWDGALRCWKHPYIINGRIHPSFRQLGARTGRMSCSDPNVQNWPRDDLRLRYLMKAKPGKKLVTADLDSIELRLFAAFAGEGDILRAIRDGHDLHQMTADAAGLKGRQRAHGFESPRQQGKTLNYAMIYAGGPAAIQRAFGVSAEEADAILKRYHAAYPEVRRLEQKVLERLDEWGFVTSPWGRRFPAGKDEQSKSRRKKFVNYLIQGTAADILKVAIVNLHKQGVPLISVVHDEIIAEVDEDQAEEVAKLIEFELTNHPRISKIIPLGAEAQIVDRWSDAKDPTFVPSFATVTT